MASKVYFTKTITPAKVIEMFKILKKDLPGKVAVKIHSGEKGNFNFIKPEFWKPVRDYVKGTFVECNTAYPGERNSTEKHKKLLKEHGWDDAGGVDLLDEEGPDITLKIPNGILIKENYIGKKTKNYDSTLVLIHFKGHIMGGYGGALKQLSIGYGSTRGKAYQHSAGRSDDQNKCWGKGVMATDKEFKESMADAASSIVHFFKGNLAYVAVLANISIDCDCCDKPEKPAISDIGILSSTDPVALDQAAYDLICKSNEPGKEKWLKRVEDRMGLHIIESATKLGIGKKEYELVNVD